MRALLMLIVAIPLIFHSCETKEKEQLKSPIISVEDKELLTHFKEVSWPKAYREQDTFLLDSLLGDDFQMIDNSGKWFGKADELEWIKENAMENDSFWYEIKRLDVLPNGTAMICGTGHIIDDSIKSIYQSSNVLVKRDGAWKAIASHVSGFKTLDENDKE